MRKLIVSNIVSLDGFSADENGNPLVLNMDDAFNTYNLEIIEKAGAVLLGRSSFEMFGSYWPLVADAPADPGNPALDDTNRAFSRVYNSLPKVVVSDSLEVPDDHPWASTTTVVARDDAAEWIAGSRDKDGGDIVVFGSHIAWNGLLAAGLVDELHLMVSPGVLGTGTPAFTAAATLDLLETRRFEGSSNVLVSYAVR